MLKLQAFDQGQKPLDLTENNGLPMELNPSVPAAAVARCRSAFVVVVPSLLAAAPEEKKTK